MNGRAVIVIGSNSTRLVAEQANGQMLRRRAETRLFLHMRDGLLAEEDIAATAGHIAFLTDGADAELIGVYATSAVRDARNADALCRAVEAACGMPLCVLSGEEEAAASFYGAAGDQKAGVIDIGSGSTEIAVGADGRVFDAVSLQLGASRLFAAHPIHSAADVSPALQAAAACCAAISGKLTDHAGVDLFFSVGGTGKAAARLILRQSGREAPIEGFVLTRDALRRELLFIAGVPRDQRGRIPGFPASRADILPTGMAILLAVMDRLALGGVTVTERTNCDGLLRTAKNRP